MMEPDGGGQVRRVALAGNPNVGKSVIFHRLSGVYAEVSNYPGTTIDLLQAQLRMGGKLLTLTDTPGVYGVGSGNEEERVARDVLLASDVVIDVVDASHLARDLFLTLQLIDMGKPLIVVLNLMDEAEASGYSVDIEELSRRLGVPVIPAVAVEGKGIEEIKAALSGHGATFRRGEVDPVVAARLNGLPQAESLLILEGDEEIAGRHRLPPGDAQEVFFLSRRRRANEIAAAVLTQKQVGRRFQQWLGEAALRPVSGVFILAVVLYGLYLVVGVGVAQNLVGFTEVRLGQEGWEPWIRGNFARYAAATISVGETSFVFPAGTARDPEQYAALAEEIAAHPDLVPTYRFESPIVKVLVGEFGVFSMTVTYLLFLLLPLVLGFHFCLSFLEDSGYLGRLAALTDRLLTGIGLNGRAVVPIILGMGCVTMATMTTRILQTTREKQIATAILNFAIPCSAQLAVITALLTPLGLGWTALYGGVIFLCLVGIGTVLNRLLPGESSALLIDLPPLRLPRLGNVVRKTLVRSYHFLKEASFWFFVGAAIVGVLDVTGGLVRIQSLLSPLTESWLHLPRQAADAFIMGMVRRDFGAAGMLDLSLSAIQTVVSLVVITLFVPCIASVMILFKERGVREALAIWGGAWVLAFTVGGVLTRILEIW